MDKQLSLPAIPATLRPRPSKQRGYKRQEPEHREQTELFKWIRLWESKVVGLSLIYAIPNGIYSTPKAKQNAIDEGLRHGVWDIHLPLPRMFGETNAQGVPQWLWYHGAWIEMKSRGKDLTPDQRDFRELMQSDRFKWAVCHTWDQAARFIYAYLQLDEPDMWEQIKPREINK